jgi:hypothetical protein
MIYQMSRDIAANLQARKFPVDVHYGPDRVTHGGCDSMRVDFSRDYEQDEVISPVLGSNRNPRAVGVRALPVLVELRVRSTLHGALLHDHQHECDALVDALEVALYEWSQAARTGALDYYESRYVKPEDDDGSEVKAGVTYRLRFRVPRGVAKRDYTGAAEPTGSAASTGLATRVTRDGVTYEDVP